MSTSIAWTDETWNPVVGCSKVHTGCTHCYAEVMAARPLPAFVGRHNLTITDGRWNGRIIENSERLLLPLKWRKPKRIFVASMSDIGHPALSDEARARIYGVMLLCPQHTFQNLTKRPQEIERFKREWSPADCLEAYAHYVGDDDPAPVDDWGHYRIVKSWEQESHIHEYVSVSDQATADEYIPQLLRVPAAVRGVSLEPMVGRVVIEDYLRKLGCGNRCHHSNDEGNLCGNGGVIAFPAIDHVIVGGESGRNARPCNVEWIRSVVEQCRATSVPCFVKQLGSNPTLSEYFDWPASDPKGGDPSEWPEDLRVRMHVGEGW